MPGSGLLNAGFIDLVAAPREIGSVSGDMLLLPTDPPAATAPPAAAEGLTTAGEGGGVEVELKPAVHKKPSPGPTAVPVLGDFKLTMGLLFLASALNIVATLAAPTLLLPRPAEPKPTPEDPTVVGDFIADVCTVWDPLLAAE